MNDLFRVVENTDRGGPANFYVCKNCGWKGAPLDLESGVVKVTENTEALTSRICPGCGKSESALCKTLLSRS